MLRRSAVSESLWPLWTVAHKAPLSMGILQARILAWVAMSSYRGPSQLRDGTQVSHIAGGFFTVLATREAQEYRSGQPSPSAGDLTHTGIEPGSPALQADSLPAELPGKLSAEAVVSYYEMCWFLKHSSTILYVYVVLYDLPNVRSWWKIYTLMWESLNILFR